MLNRKFHRPCSLTLNPLLYSAISIEKSYCLDANQAIIVYKQETNESYKYKLTITKGPGIFMIQPDEWFVKYYYESTIYELIFKLEILYII